MFWHITALKFRISLVLKFSFDLSPFYVEELVREKKHSSLPWLAYYDSLKNFSLRPFARTMFSSERRKNLPPLQNAAIQIYLLAFTEDLGFKTLWIKIYPRRGKRALLCQFTPTEKSWPSELLANEPSYFINSWCFRNEPSQKDTL